jgi:hypothetical protein
VNCYAFGFTLSVSELLVGRYNARYITHTNSEAPISGAFFISGGDLAPALQVNQAVAFERQQMRADT